MAGRRTVANGTEPDTGGFSSSLVRFAPPIARGTVNGSTATSAWCLSCSCEVRASSKVQPMALFLASIEANCESAVFEYRPSCSMQPNVSRVCP